MRQVVFRDFRSGWAAAFLLIASVAPVPAVAEHQETTLYRFAGGKDGYEPAGVVEDNSGNLYGMTIEGGDPHCDCGTIFELASDGTKTTLYTFLGNDGAQPLGRLSRDSAGNLFGTTEYGGADNFGVVFKLSHRGTMTLLHSFSGGTDGAYPAWGRLLRDSSGNLFGTTDLGGDLSCFPPNGCGVVFKIAPTGEETVLHAFHGGSDGWSLVGGLTKDEQGNLYGTTQQGGSHTNDNCAAGCGTIFKIAPDGSETILHSFDGAAGGYIPDSPPVMDAKGNFYGSTDEGGHVAPNCEPGCGLIYRLSTDGRFDVLYRFSGGADGTFPTGGLRIDDHGNLFGNTAFGGRFNRGTVFRLDPHGAEHTLYTFRRGDGFSPDRLLAMDDNYLYGTTSRGGLGHRHKGFGTVFRVRK
jgi:uncharacterized repeat protein (TIGR03803 family)